MTLPAGSSNIFAWPSLPLLNGNEGCCCFVTGSENVFLLIKEWILEMATLIFLIINHDNINNFGLGKDGPVMFVACSYAQREPYKDGICSATKITQGAVRSQSIRFGQCLLLDMELASKNEDANT